MQYYRNRIDNIVVFGEWLNILDKDFNIHIIDKNIKKTIVNIFVLKNKKNILVNFFDKSNAKILEISSSKKFQANFNKEIFNFIKKEEK